MAWRHCRLPWWLAGNGSLCVHGTYAKCSLRRSADTDAVTAEHRPNALLPEVIKVVVLLNAGCTCKAGHYQKGVPDRFTCGRQHKALNARPWVFDVTASVTCRHRQLQGMTHQT